MLSGISTLCFVGSYAIALALELVGLARRFAWHRAALFGVTAAGFFAQTIYLWNLAATTKATPLSSPAEWLLLSAWVLVLVYLGAIVNLPRSASGLILLPIILALIGASRFATSESFAPERASQF